MKNEKKCTGTSNCESLNSCRNPILLHQAPSTIKGRGAVIRGATVMANLLQICEQNAVLGVPPLYWRRDLRTTITRWLMPGFERVLSPR